jgi:hypothetical protein
MARAGGTAKRSAKGVPDRSKAKATDSASEDLAALGNLSLDELKQRHPAEWQEIGAALVRALETGHAAGAAKFLTRARAEAAPWRVRVRRSGGNPRVIAAAYPQLVRQRMAELAVKQALEGAAAVRAGVDPSAAAPALRFSRWSGGLIQRLFFHRVLARKPVSWGWFRVVWPLVGQKALLMPLVEPRGIYCFYSRPLVAGLAALIAEAGGEALEIAAGDGTLARFLNAAGANVHVRATDDRSWSHAISFPDDVEPLDAATALTRYAPKVVLCSWPPPDNRFEAAVFAAASVERYIVLTTRHRFAAGAWPAYEAAQGSFARRVDERLSGYVLPPEIDPVVLVFDRRRDG